MKNFFKHLWMEVNVIFSRHLSKGWEAFCTDLLNGLTTAKTYFGSEKVATVADLFPNGIGHVALAKLQQMIVDLIPTLEIAKGCTIPSALSPAEKADAVLQFVLGNISKLPEDMQGKHLEDIARKLAEVELQLSTTAAKAILNTLLGKLKASL
jgi:hypothetical protein